jgi:hypothetical protein
MHAGSESFFTMTSGTDILFVCLEKGRKRCTVRQVAGKTVTNRHRTMYEWRGTEVLMADEAKLLLGADKSPFLGLIVTIVTFFFLVGSVPGKVIILALSAGSRGNGCSCGGFLLLVVC